MKTPFVRQEVLEGEARYRGVTRSFAKPQQKNEERHSEVKGLRLVREPTLHQLQHRARCLRRLRSSPMKVIQQRGKKHSSHADSNRVKDSHLRLRSPLNLRRMIHK